MEMNRKLFVFSVCSMVSMCDIQPLKMLNKIEHHKLQQLFNMNKKNNCVVHWYVKIKQERRKNFVKVKWYVIYLEWSRNLSRMITIADIT